MIFNMATAELVNIARQNVACFAFSLPLSLSSLSSSVPLFVCLLKHTRILQFHVCTLPTHTHTEQRKAIDN